jgi:hypothetical protein
MSFRQADQPPNRVVLFSGHMIDAPDRKTPRFPPDKEDDARRAIDGALDKIGVTEADLAICGGACGGDLLFAEACLARTMRLEIYIPFDEPTFLIGSVDFAGDRWHQRYLQARSKAAALHVMTVELGELPPGEDAYERVNRWMLDAADRFDGDRMAFICLWNGEAGDGPGGAQHFMEEVRRRTARVHWLDTRQL